MARRRVKKRTHAGAQAAPNDAASGKAMDRSPKSMVIRMGAGEVGPAVSQLVKDVRQVMEPHTAARLKERKKNRLRDFTTMTGPLGVTHLLLFSRSSSGNTNMRLAVTPRGPTLHFRVEKYSLCKDIMKAQKHPRAGGHEYQTAPLLVMNNFISPDASTTSTVPKHLESLITTMFQNLFPPVSPQTAPLNSIRRVLLLNREPSSDPESGTYTLNFRHYAITTKQIGLPKSIRRLNAAEKLITSREKKKRGLPNLGKLEDVADYMLDPSAAGYTSASESEMESDAEVEILQTTARRVLDKKGRQRAAARVADGGDGADGRNGSGVEKRAVKLVELGPRMKLRLMKVEDGVCAGKILWHEFIHKSKEEVKEQDEIWDQRRKEKEERRRIQKENVEKKKKAKGDGKERDDDEEDEFDYEDYDMDDDVWDSEGEMEAEQKSAAQEDHDDDEMDDDEG